MSRSATLLVTAIAPTIWGSSYLVTTELLPNLDPLTVAFLRALPAGLLLLMVVRALPKGIWVLKMFVLGALNFSIFWSLLFFAAYRLPGGVAAVIGALQPLLVVFAARLLLHNPIRIISVLAALAGVGGIALLILTPEAELDPLGLVAGFLGAVSMALGNVLSRKWQPPVSTLTFTAWQLTAGGLLLLPVTLLAGSSWVGMTGANIVGLLYLGLIGAALTYVIWLRGLARLPPSSVAILAFLSPVTATVLGWSILGETLSGLQILGVGIVLASVFLGQFARES